MQLNDQVYLMLRVRLLRPLAGGAVGSGEQPQSDLGLGLEVLRVGFLGADRSEPPQPRSLALGANPGPYPQGVYCNPANLAETHCAGEAHHSLGGDEG